jgi:hypothetical protein
MIVNDPAAISRRQFLQYSAGLAAAAAWLGPHRLLPNRRETRSST